MQKRRKPIGCIASVKHACADDRACTVPERATMSVVLSPFLAKALMRPLRLAVGPGRSLLARDALAVVASRLPRGTVQDGPPSCTNMPDVQ